MDWIIIFFILIMGLILGLFLSYLFRPRHAQIQAILEKIKDQFGSLSLEALSNASNELIKLSKEKLDSDRDLHQKILENKKGLIDQELERMNQELGKVSTLVNDLEKDRTQKFGELTTLLKSSHEQTSNLIHTTNTLREALANSKARGQWGERMAEDVLRLSGLIENINYIKQKAMKSGSIPDFTILLPKNLIINMDVKFPLDNYIRYLEASSDLEKESFRISFMKDVKSRIKEVTDKDYINPQENTVDYVLLFIPNEQIYAFIHEQDHTLLDEGIKNHVILCSPMTLFAVLAVIRQAVENFALEQTSTEILSILSTFKKQWSEFLKKLESIGKHISDLQKDYDTLITTRRRQLDRPLQQIDDLKQERGLAKPTQEEVKL